MVDRAARDRVAELLRHLVSGRITNFEFEDALPRNSEDRALKAVFWNGSWLLYDDLLEHKLVGAHALRRGGRREVARWVLFLRSDLPYEWPSALWLFRFPGYLVVLATLGIAGILAAGWLKRAGDRTVWPFIRRSDYEMELSRPTYLAGTS
jgi:hypothetical protein